MKTLVSIEDLLAEGYKLTHASYFTRTSKHPKIQALLAELGFQRSNKNFGCLICEKEKWLLCLTNQHKSRKGDFKGLTVEGCNNIVFALGKDSFPVDRTLRLKRLKALLA